MADALEPELAARWEALGAAVAIRRSAGERRRTDADWMRRWEREGRRLRRHWRLWPRRYHTTAHLAACLRHAERVADALGDAAAVNVALWFHDAVYWPWSRRNEAASADWSRDFLLAMELPPEFAARVENLILATRHGMAAGASQDADTAWLLDIDLAILGADEVAYLAFERGVRAEYRFVRWSRYAAGRGAILRGFQARAHIYETDWFREQLEARARSNLARAIEALEQGRRPG